MNKNGKVYPRLQIYKYVYQDLINREVHYKSFLSKEVCEILSIKWLLL